jgi:hypothetical protein
MASSVAHEGWLKKRTGNDWKRCVGRRVLAGIEEQHAGNLHWTPRPATLCDLSPLSPTRHQRAPWPRSDVSLVVPYGMFMPGFCGFGGIGKWAFDSGHGQVALLLSISWDAPPPPLPEPSPRAAASWLLRMAAW